MSYPDKIIYVVHACIPNKMAHSIQITHTAETLSHNVKEFALVTPFFFGSSTIDTNKSTVVHLRLPALDLAMIPMLRYHLRFVTFIFSLYFYLCYEYAKSKYRGQSVVIYIRGEVVFGLVPFLKLFPIYFETHYIRNHSNAYRWLLRHVTGAVVITDRLKSMFVDKFGINPDKVAVARDAVDIDTFSNFNAEKTSSLRSKFPAQKNIVLYSGSLSREKGVYTLADIASLLDSVHIVFVGGLDSQIKSFRENYGNIDNISIMGRVDHSEISNYLHCADILVLPDLATDTFGNLYTSPMKLFEYMASGVGIVAADVPSLKEVLNEDNSFFFESGNADSLAGTIKYMLNNVDEVRSRALKAQEDVLEFTWDKRADLIMSLVSGQR